MAPNKFDTNLKEKLEQRTIQPSDNAWSQLSDRLDAQEKSSEKRWFLYIGIAASLVGVLLVSTWFFKSSETNKGVAPVIVETELKEQAEDANEKNQNEHEAAVVIANTLEDAPTEDVIVTTTPEVEKSTTRTTQVATVSNKRKINEVSLEAFEKNINEKAVVANEIQDTQRTAVLTAALTSEQIKINEVVAQIRTLHTQGVQVSDAEIDSLLKQAEKELLRDRIYNETTRTVDADALLQDVELDIQKSFRTKVFETLKSSFKTVKTAVAERNQ